MRAKSGVVDQNVHDDSPALQFGDIFRGISGRERLEWSQLWLQLCNPGAILRQVFPKPSVVRYQNQPRAFGGEATRQFQADSRRRPGDQNRFEVGRAHCAVMECPTPFRFVSGQYTKKDLPMTLEA